MNWNRGVFPSLHHRKEGWLSKSKNIAKHPLIAKPGWFSDGLLKENHPGCVRFGGYAKLFDDAATPPCGDARRGLPALDLQFIRTFSCSHLPITPLRANSIKASSVR